MNSRQEVQAREAKVISLTQHKINSPQIPEQPVSQATLQLHTLEFIDQLLDEHFR